MNLSRKPSTSNVFNKSYTMNYLQEIHNIVPAWISWFLPQGTAFTSYKHNPYSKHLNHFYLSLIKTLQQNKDERKAAIRNHSLTTDL